MLDVLRSSWDQSLEKFPAQGTPSFLDPGEFLVSRDWCGFGNEHDTALRNAAERIRRAPVGFTCRSWIFSPCLEHCLPPESNLVRFLKETYLFPIASTGPGSLWFVFLQSPFDPATAPRETRLQCALLDYLAAGHTWRTGGMFFLTDDLPAFGTQCYRRNWPVL